MPQKRTSRSGAMTSGSVFPAAAAISSLVGLRNTDRGQESVARLGRRLAPVVFKSLRRQRPAVVAQQHDGEDLHEVRGEIEAGAAMPGDRPRPLRRERMLVPLVLSALGREAVGIELLWIVVHAVLDVARPQ